MPAPVIAAAIVSAKASALKDLTKGIRDVGQKILSQLFGCKIKPKGTKHEEVYKKCPKYFAWYGTGIPESGTYRFSGKGVIIEPITGYALTQSELEKMLPLADRRAIEATVRKKCERVTGSFAYYIEVRPASDYRGYVRLADGNVYDAATYSLDGGELNNPKSFSRVEPKSIPGQKEVFKSENNGGAGTGGIKQAGLLGGINPVFLIVGVVLAIAFSMGK